MVLKVFELFLVYNPYTGEEGIHIRLSNHNIYTGLHPSCSTPFKRNPKTGEINTNLQIKGFKNLYILGTNVFPTNGVTNPTWTLMTLAKRLACYLKEKNE